MRTTLNIDDEIYMMAKHLAERDNYSIGDMISELARKGLEKEILDFNDDEFPVMPTLDNGKKITIGMVNTSRDEVE